MIVVCSYLPFKVQETSHITDSTNTFPWDTAKQTPWLHSFTEAYESMGVIYVNYVPLHIINKAITFFSNNGWSPTDLGNRRNDTLFSSRWSSLTIVSTIGWGTDHALQKRDCTSSTILIFTITHGSKMVDLPQFEQVLLTWEREIVCLTTTAIATVGFFGVRELGPDSFHAHSIMMCIQTHSVRKTTKIEYDYSDFYSMLRMSIESAR